MISPSRVRILNACVDAVTQTQALDRVKAFLRSPHKTHQIVTLNSLMLYEAQKDAELARVLEEAELVIPDSSGILWAAKKLGTPVPERIPGIDFFQALCRLAQEEKIPLALLGAKPQVLEKTVENLQNLYPGLLIAYRHHGYFNEFEEEEIVRQIRLSEAALLFVGLDTPRQEKWIRQHLSTLGVPVAMGIGGSLDVLSHNLQRAPRWMQEKGLEWLYRFHQEPWRWRRIARLPLFAWLILRQSFQKT